MGRVLPAWRGLPAKLLMRLVASNQGEPANVMIKCYEARR